MRLILFQIGNFKVYSYGFMIAIGIVLASTLFIKRAKREGYDEDKLLNLIIITVISGALGGKLLFIITEYKAILNNPEILLNFGNGFVIYGAIMLGAFGLYLYSKRCGFNTLQLADLAVPSLALAQGFGRIGCFLAGCCYGRETSLPIGVVFPVDSLAESGVPLIPTQLFSSIFDFALAAFLLWYSGKKRKEGRVLASYIIIYSIGRFFVEFLRNDPRGNVWILSTSQFIAIFTLIFGIVIYNLDKTKRRDKQNEEK
ncbi:MAG: prolipoprotein diacylglyceryl transferase [Clostridium sp.]|uniref:prolipoprotein diacylglyceryl transferase n=1 Tax=Clostridium sp. TaxID=1506 RepID=UPI003F2A7277